MAEQLLFTWADHGLEGRGMWQIVAATERLFRRLPKARQQARDLCTDFAFPSLWQDPATAPVSFGWQDIRGVRYAFRRVYRGADRFGRPGVFAAHVLVDRPEHLPADMLLATADSPSWWSGELPPITNGDWMPTVTLDGFEPAKEGFADDDTAAAVLTAVLAHRGRPLLLAMQSAPAIEALRRTAALLPGILDDLSVSTYEPSATRSQYGLAVTQPPDDDPRAITVEALLDAAAVAAQRNVARLTVADDVRSSTYVHHAWEAVRYPSQHARDAFIDVCSSFLALERSTAPTADELLPAMHYPNTAADLLDDLEVRTVVARALGAGNGGVLSALRTVGHSLEPETWSSLGELTAQAATTKVAVAVVTQMLNTVTDVGFQAFVGAMVALSHDDPSRTTRWPADLLPYAWMHAATSASTTLRKVIIQAGAPNLRQLASHRAMPADLWSLMLVEAFNTGIIQTDTAAGAVLANRDFAREVGRTAPIPVLKALLDVLPPTHALKLLSTWATPERADIWINLANRLAQRLDSGTAWQTAAAVTSCIRHPVPVDWPALRDRVIRQRLTYELSDIRSEPCRLTDACQPDAGSHDRVWYDFLRLLTPGTFASSWRQYTNALARHLDHLPEPDRRLASRFALQAVVAHTMAAEDLATIVPALARQLEDDLDQVAEFVLYGGLRATIARHSAGSGQAALAYVAMWLVEPGAIALRKRTGELSRRSAQDLAVHLYTALTIRDSHLERHCQVWAEDRPRAERWLHGLRQ